MKIQFALAACLILSGAALPPTSLARAPGVAAPLDLSMRRAAYFNFHLNGEIDLRGRRVAAGGTIKINKGSHTSCAAGCQFAVGLFVFRDTAEGEPAFTVSVVGEQTHTMVFGFKKGEKIREARHETPPLKVGANKLKVMLDPENKYAESDESNNSFEFTVILED